MRWLAAFGVVVGLVAVGCALHAPPKGYLPATTVLANIKVATPSFAGYNRDLFHYPADLDHDRCDTRGEVLIRDSLGPVVVTPGFCIVTSGRWYSAYDGVTTTVAAALQIDHVVPLAEAWASGASGCSHAGRTAFGNDLTDRRTLREVTVHANETKGDQDPAQWLPPLVSDQCPYIGDWISIKARWASTMDSAESTKLHAMLARQCKGLAVAPYSAAPG
jgi:hypothetical protein